MDKQKIRSLDEERESRNLLSNTVVVLYLVFGTLPLLFVVWAVDRLMGGTLTPAMLWSVGVAMVLFALFRGVFYGISIWRAHYSAYNALTRLRMRIVSHLQRLPIGFFQERKVGDLVNIINHDVEQIEMYLAHGLPEILSATLFPALLWGIVMVLDWRLGLALVSLLPLAFLLQMTVKTLWSKSFQHFMESTHKMSEDLLEYVATIPVIKAFSHEETRTERVLCGMRDYIRRVTRDRADDAHNDVFRGWYRGDDARWSVVDGVWRADRDTLHPRPDIGRTVLVLLCQTGHVPAFPNCLWAVAGEGPVDYRSARKGYGRPGYGRYAERCQL